MREVLVRDWMHEGVITCRPDTPVTEVAETMKAHGISALVVVDDDRLAVGVISKTDIANAVFVLPYLHHWRGMIARHLMSSPVIAVHADTPIAEALDLLQRGKIHRLVVTEKVPGGERPVGVLSMTDIVPRMGVPESV
jgi:CBS domain-containing protein